MIIQEHGLGTERSDLIKLERQAGDVRKQNRTFRRSLRDKSQGIHAIKKSTRAGALKNQFRRVRALLPPNNKGPFRLSTRRKIQRGIKSQPLLAPQHGRSIIRLSGNRRPNLPVFRECGEWGPRADTVRLTRWSECVARLWSILSQSKEAGLQIIPSPGKRGVGERTINHLRLVISLLHPKGSACFRNRNLNSHRHPNHPLRPGAFRVAFVGDANAKPRAGNPKCLDARGRQPS